MSVSAVPVDQRPLRYGPACEACWLENRQLVSVRPGQSGRPRQKACGSAGNSKKADKQGLREAGPTCVGTGRRGLGSDHAWFCQGATVTGT